MVDVGTSGVRAGVVGPDGAIDHVRHVEVLPSSPAPGFVEFGPRPPWPLPCSTWRRHTRRRGGPVAGVGIANQRASTIVWDRGQR